jgi:hypothetical protein
MNKLWDQFDEEFHKLKIQREPKLKDFEKFLKKKE